MAGYKPPVKDAPFHDKRQREAAEHYAQAQAIGQALQQRQQRDLAEAKRKK